MSSPPAAPTEIELKFQLAPDAVKRLTDNPVFAGSARRKRLHTIFYDTPDYDLREGGMSLRVRESEGRFVQTVKSRLGASLFDRNEWEAEISGARPDPAGLDQTPVCGLLAKDPPASLEAVFVTDVERTVQDCHHAGAVIEVALDQGEIIAGDQHEPICELELELKSGDPAALFDLARTLGGEGDLRLSFETKSERGYRLAGRDTARALKAERAQLTPQTPAGDAFRRIVRACLAQITGNASRLMKVQSPDALHQLRVGLRRLRAGLKVFETVVRDDHYARIDAEARWATRSLNAARDLDVLLRSIAPAGDDSADEEPSLAALRQRLIQAQTRAYEDALAAVGSSRFARFLLDLAAWAEAGPWTASQARKRIEVRDAPVSVLAIERLNHLRKAARKAGRNLDRQSPEARHKVRIRIKKLRYAADFFAEAVGRSRSPRTAPFMDALRSLQDAMGELNDVAVAAETLASVVNAPGGAGAGFAAGRILGRREAQEPALLAHAVEAFRRFEAARRFW